jgi:hypothetical protein
LYGGSAVATQIRTNGSGNLIYTDAAGDHAIQSITANTWYSVKTVVNTTANTYDIYVGGVLKVSGAAFKTAASSIDSFKVTSGTSLTKTLYIDDVKVYQ